MCNWRTSIARWSSMPTRKPGVTQATLHPCASRSRYTARKSGKRRSATPRRSGVEESRVRSRPLRAIAAEASVHGAVEVDQLHVLGSDPERHLFPISFGVAGDLQRHRFLEPD